MFQETRGAAVSAVLTDTWTVMDGLLTKKRSCTSNSTCRRTPQVSRGSSRMSVKVPVGCVQDGGGRDATS